MSILLLFKNAKGNSVGHGSTLNLHAGRTLGTQGVNRIPIVPATRKQGHGTGPLFPLTTSITLLKHQQNSVSLA